MLLTYQFEIKVNNKLGIILGHLTYAASKLFNVGNYERKEKAVIPPSLLLYFCDCSAFE